MSALRADLPVLDQPCVDQPCVGLPDVEWLTDDQMAAVDRHELVGAHELLVRSDAGHPWSVRLREAAHSRLDLAAEGVWGLTIKARRLSHNLQRHADLRHHSEVAHHLGHSFEEVVDALDGPIEEHAGGVQLRCRTGEVTTRPTRFEAEGSLRIPASYPELPVRLSVEPWWRDRCVVGISLRSTRRIRYPRRYYVSAHRVLTQLTDSGFRLA